MKLGSGSPAPERAAVLIGVLWCLVVLSFVVVGMLRGAQLELRLTKNQADLIQAHFAALAGVERAKALLFHDAKTARASGTTWVTRLRNAPEDFRDVTLGSAVYRVLRAGSRGDGPGGKDYGVTDLESRLNVNAASAEDLQKLPGMTQPTAAAIADWIDDDHTLTPGGAERETYLSRAPPYVPRNGPLESLAELFLVQGVRPDLLAGEDSNLNGLLDPGEDGGRAAGGRGFADGFLDRGWSSLLTAQSAVRDVNARGTTRVSLTRATETELAGVEGISSELARAIVAHRGQGRFESIVDLLDVAAPAQPNAPPRPPPGPGEEAAEGGAVEQPQAPGQRGTGQKLVSEALLQQLADNVTVADGLEIEGPVNINTAEWSVLACLPGVTETLARAIADHRASSGHFANIAQLLNVAGMTRDILKGLAARVCTRSETFHILAEGYLPATGAKKRIEVVVRLGTWDVETLSWREDP